MRTRIRFVICPLEARVGGDRGVLAIITLILYIVTLLGFAIVLAVALVTADVSLTQICIGSLGIVIVAPILWAYWRAYRRRHPKSGGTRRRLARLEAIEANLAGVVRLPHRVVEHALLRAGDGWGHRIREIPAIPLGFTTIIIDRKNTNARAMSGLDVSFEPVDFWNEPDAADLLARVDERYSLSAKKDPIPTVKWWHFPRHMRNPTGSFLFFAAQMWVWFSVWEMLKGTFSWRRGLLFAFVIAIIVLQWFVPLIYDRRWWLVPGGFVRQEDRAWWRRLRFSMFSPETHHLVLDFRGTGEGWLFSDSRPIFIRFLPSLGPLLAAGWTSTARSPTDAEIHSLFGSAER
ncbi:MAG: hypothetical protein HY287_10050 [Planctomycetes bacterium]|nr:hypothetical protein [Planctomycetota bacterium]MBI3834657.1 hypothetical protein [Planctomycetota bacterium]